MTKLDDYPVYTTGIAQLQRLQNELQSLSFASEIIKNPFLPLDTEIIERWDHISRENDNKSSHYLIHKKPILFRSKSVRTQRRFDLLSILDNCFHDPDTRKIILHCHSWTFSKTTPNTVQIMGVVTLQQGSSALWGPRSKLQKMKDWMTGRYGSIAGLRLCIGEQRKAQYSYNPLYLLKEISAKHRDYISIPYQLNPMDDIPVESYPGGKI